MMIVRILCCSTTILLLIAASVSAQPAQERESPGSPVADLYSRIDSLRVAAGSPSLQVALLDSDTTILWNFGLADPLTGAIVDDQTLFRAGSVSKSFAGMAMLLLVEQGLVSLEDELLALAPELPIRNPWWPQRPVRVSHLLEASGGFVGFHASDHAPADPPEIALSQAIRTLPYRLDVQWPPGEYTAYHNIGPAITAYLVEKLTGELYEDFIQASLFDPLGMEHSSFFRSKAVAARLAYAPLSEGTMANPRWRGILDEAEDPREFYRHIRFRPAGALNTNAAELSAFVRMLMNRGAVEGRQLLAPATVERFELPTSTLAARKLGTRLGHGVNNWTELFQGTVYHQHGGNVAPSYDAWYAYAPETGTGFVIMATRGESGQPFHNHVKREILGHLHRDILATQAPASTGPDASLAGCFRHVNPDGLGRPGHGMRVIADGEVLRLEISAPDVSFEFGSTLEPMDEDGIYRLSESPRARSGSPWEDVVAFVTDDRGVLIGQFLSRPHLAYERAGCLDD